MADGAPGTAVRAVTLTSASSRYLAEVRRVWAAGMGTPQPVDLLRSWSKWRRGLSSNSSTLDDALPWLPFRVIRYLDRHLRPDMRVFEYGAGGSTLFFATRALEVHSVEHDEEWGRMVEAELFHRRITSVRLRLIGPEPASGTGARKAADSADPLAYLSSDPLFADKTFCSYAQSIDELPDGSVDVVVVDGRARPSCFQHAMPKVAPSGLLLLDNSERRNYRPVQEAARAAGWRAEVITGPTAHNPEFTQTTVWRRPSP